MNFGNVSAFGMIFVLLGWSIPLLLVVWFIRTLSGIAASLRDIVDRLAALERAVRDNSASRAT